MRKDANGKIMSCEQFYEMLDEIYPKTSDKFKAERKRMRKDYQAWYKTLGLLLQVCKTPSEVISMGLIFFACEDAEFWLQVRRILLDREVSQ